MAYEFTKLSEVPSIEEFPETGNVLIEDNGEIKKCKTDGLGGGKIEIIELIYEGEEITGPTNKTPEEYWEAMKAGTTFIIDITFTDGSAHIGDTLAAFQEAEDVTVIVGRVIMYQVSDGTGKWVMGI